MKPNFPKSEVSCPRPKVALINQKLEMNSIITYKEVAHIDDGFTLCTIGIEKYIPTFRNTLFEAQQAADL